MQKNAAEQMMYDLMEIEKHLGAINSVICDLPDGDEKNALWGGMAEMLKVINFSFVFEIIKQFPELDPDKNKGFSWPPQCLK